MHESSPPFMTTVRDLSELTTVAFADTLKVLSTEYTRPRVRSDKQLAHIQDKIPHATACTCQGFQVCFGFLLSRILAELHPDVRNEVVCDAWPLVTFLTIAELFQ